MDFVATEEQAFFFRAETDDVLHHPFPRGQLRGFHIFAVSGSVGGLLFVPLGCLREVEQVKVVEPIALALVDEFGVVPWQEQQSVHWFHVLGMVFFIDYGLFGSCGRIVAHQFRVVLVAVQFNHVHFAAVGAPRDVGEVAVSRVAGLQPHGFARSGAEYAHRDFVHGFSCHRVFVGIRGGNACRDVHLRIVGHHALVHAVESQLLSVGTPEGALCDAELVAVHGFAIHQVVAAVGGDGHVLPVCRGDVQVMLPHVGQILGAGREVLQAGVGRAFHRRDALSCREVHYGIDLCAGAVGQFFARDDGSHVRLLSVGELYVVATAHGRFVFVGFQPLVQLFQCEQGLLASVFRVYLTAFLQIHLYALVSPPCGMDVPGLHLAVRAAAGEQVVQREALFSLCHGQERE